jgi:hypothetical protein
MRLSDGVIRNSFAFFMLVLIQAFLIVEIYEALGISDLVSMTSNEPTGYLDYIELRFYTVIAHPTLSSASTGSLATNTNRRTSSTEARLAFAVLTTERKAA